MTEREEKVFKIANNILCFDDNSDYGSALWEILLVLKPDLKAEYEDELIYINDKE
jgi:hypothetical protein